MNQKTFSQQFPQLVQITAKFLNRQLASDDNSTQRLAFFLVNAFNQREFADAIETFKEGVQKWFTTSKNPEDDIEELTSFFATYQLSIPDLFAYFSEMAVRQGEGIKLARVYQQIACASKNPLFHFLAAWIFLNLNQLDACIQQCHEIDFPFSPVQSLLGQALMENLQIDEACLALQSSVQMNPQDLTSWFLLAKAYFSINQLEEAWEALMICNRLSPANIEVQTMMGLVAADKHGTNQAWADLAWQELLKNWQHTKGHGLLTVLMYQLAFRLEDREKVHYLTGAGDWRQLTTSPEFLKNLAQILRAFQSRGWIEENLYFLYKIEPSLEASRS